MSNFLYVDKNKKKIELNVCNVPTVFKGIVTTIEHSVIEFKNGNFGLSTMMLKVALAQAMAFDDLVDGAKLKTQDIIKDCLEEHSVDYNEFFKTIVFTNDFFEEHFTGKKVNKSNEHSNDPL